MLTLLYNAQIASALHTFATTVNIFSGGTQMLDRPGVPGHCATGCDLRRTDEKTKRGGCYHLRS